ncbi:hypothetical protein MKQ68_10180 [Chitinophaga horti]|uniref:Uncharacterized protein n=1 Tax=Chitinophaga horti TaxID=2920382 RepID=A0ABY6J718_9BACT|nr:hypothetical protein [Chitinophaga horti]UYQ95466.1 hypothetical protein MKQ68_10180 [Chitinophaga horti]
MSAALITRWDTFLQKIETRFAESLELGEQAALDSLDESDYDYYVSLRTLTAIRTQIDESLIRKIDETWQYQVYPAMQAEGMSWGDEARKGYALQDALHDRLHLWMMVAEGKLSEKYYTHAIGLINRDFRCTQCNSPLQVKKDFFMSQYVSCRYCGAVNTFEPETKYATIGWNVVDSMSELYAMPAYLAMRNIPQDNREAYANAARAYVEKYIDERIKLLPHTAETREQDIDRKLKRTI